MNQILIDTYENNFNSKKDLKKNLGIIKYLIIILTIFCCILTGILIYRIYNDKTLILSQDNFNDKLVIIENTIIDNSTMVNFVENAEKSNSIENIVSSDDNIIVNEIIPETKLEIVEPTVYKTSNGEKYTIIGKLNIPAININMNVLSSTSTALLKVSLNKYWGGEPNEVGNFCIVGHNYENGTHFSNLYKLDLGDTIKLTDNYNRILTYTIYDKYVVDPYDTKCTSQLTNGNTEITLITCHNSGKQRLVIKARA